MLTLLFPQSAALVKTKSTKTLVIADPHIGWEHALQEKGIHVPNQTHRIIEKLIALLSEHKPDSLLILGDVKFTVNRTEPGEWRDIPHFFSEIRDYVAEISIIRGNHDANLEPLLPEEVKILPATGTTLGEIGFFHGHKWPSPTMLECRTLLMGHVHPAVVFKDPSGFKTTKQVWIKAQLHIDLLSKILLSKQKKAMKGSAGVIETKQFRIKREESTLFIVPSFNDFLGGRAINEPNTMQEGHGSQLIGPVLKSGIVNIDKAELYLTDGTYLGTTEQFRSIHSGQRAAKNLYKANL